MKKNSEIHLNDIGDGYEVTSIEDLVILEDDIGDEIDFEDENVENGREKAFAYKDKEIYFGNGHGDCVKQMTDNEEERKNILECRFERLPSYELAWGHVTKDVAVIELNLLSADIDDVIQALKARGYRKIYTVPDMFDHTVTRIAYNRLKRVV